MRQPIQMDFIVESAGRTNKPSNHHTEMKNRILNTLWFNGNFYIINDEATSL